MMRLGIVAALMASIQCGPGGSGDPVHPDTDPAARELLRVVLSRPIVVPDNGVLRPDEFAGVATDAARGLLYTGGRDKTLLALDRESGQVRWEMAIDDVLASTPTLTRDGQTLLFGTDDGTFMAVDLERRRTRWSYATDGRIRNRAIEGDGVVYFVNSRDEVYALHVGDGSWRWWYTREFQTEFTVFGRAGITFVPGGGPGEVGVLYTGFDDGRVVAVDGQSGDALWIQSLAPPEGGAFADCDSTPLPLSARAEIVAVGQATGVHGLALDDGRIAWRLPMRGGSSVVAGPGSTLIVTSSLEGVIAFEPGGRVLWRHQLDPGVATGPIMVDDVVVLGHSEIGLLGFDAHRGVPILQLRTGSGISGTPSWDPAGRRLYAISNRGTLIGFSAVAPG